MSTEERTLGAQEVLEGVILDPSSAFPKEKCEGKGNEGRLWCFVSYNKEPPTIVDEIQYLGYEYEICPKTKRPHWQGFLYLKQKKKFGGVQKVLAKTHTGETKYKPINMRYCKGNFEQNVKYCSKEGGYVEFGEKPKPGARTDLNILRDEIVAGKRVDEIAIELPWHYHMYGRTLSKIEDLTLRKKFRTEMTQGIWIYGPTGVGKSHEAFKDYNPDTHYLLPDDNGWWDAYKQQDIVIINDFRGKIPYNELLQLVDKWPYSVKRRNKEPMPFISKKVIITSSLHPDQIYINRNAKDNIKQLLRRFEVIEMNTPYKEDDK